MDRLTILYLLLASLVTVARAHALTIYGFVPGNNVIYSALYQVPAACMALDDINNSSLLLNYTLELSVAAPECDVSEGVLDLIEAVITRKPGQEQLPVMFLDGGCSVVTESLAALTGQLYNATMVSFGSSSPSLSDQDRFPKLFRTIPSETQVNMLRFSIMNMFNWTRVATLYQTNDSAFSASSYHFSAGYNLLFPNSSNNDILISRSFSDDPSISLQQIKDNDIHIIFVWMYEDKAVNTFCKAVQLGLTTENHVWIIPGWYAQGWWTNAENDTNGNCTSEQIEEALDCTLVVDAYSYSQEPNIPGVSGRDADSFIKTYCNYQTAFMKMVASNGINTPFSCSNLKPSYAVNNCSINKHSYTPFMYDAVWSMALALQKADSNLTTNFSTSLANFSYNNTNITDAIFSAMTQTNFRGVSGNLLFDSTGSRNGLNALYQIRRGGPQGLCLKLIAVHDPVRENYTFQNSTYIIWKGGSIPMDRIRTESIYLSPPVVKMLHTLTTISIVVALTILLFNTATIWKPLIADSAPHINTIVIIGCLLLLITCYLLGVDSNNPPPVTSDINQRYATICTFRLWFLTIGFTMSFGSLFGKTWQAHRIHVDSKLKHKPFKMWNFLIILSILLIIDVTYLSIWTVLWPFQRNTYILDSDFQVLQQQYEYCSCDKYNYLIGILYVLKGSIVLFGLFLAYETRNVDYKYLNDAKYVSFATYVVVIVVGIGAPLSLVLAQNWLIDSAYGLAVVMIISACLSCLLILYIPKIVYMARGKDTLLVPGANNEEKIVTANEIQMGWTDPELHRDEGSSAQNKQNLEGKEGTKACASLSSETDSGVNMNIDEMDCTLPTTEDCTEGTIHSSENVICFNE